MKKSLALGSLSILVFALLLAGCGPKQTPTESGQSVDEQPVSETSVTDVSPLTEEEGQRSETSQETSQPGGSVIDWSKQFPGTESSPEEERAEKSAEPSFVDEAGTTQEEALEGLASVGLPAWSPDGARIAFLSFLEEGPWDIWVMNANGSNPRKLTNTPAKEGLFSWAPTGREIAFLSFSEKKGQSDIFLSNADGSDVRNLTNTTNLELDPRWSPDGARIAFVSSPDEYQCDIWVMNPDGTDQRNLTNDPNYYEVYPRWSPDGTRIAFVSSPDEGQCDIWVMNADGSERRIVVYNTGEISPCTWSSDGTRIAFVSSSDEDQCDIWVMNADGSDRRTLTSDRATELAPQWSPDGAKIAFYSTSGEGQTDIWVMNADGTNPRNLTNNPAEEGLFSWSPDGTRIAFTSRSTQNDSSIWVINADGNNLQRLTQPVLEVTIEEKRAETQQLVDSLEQLKTAIVEKIDSDVEAVSISFTDVKDYWRAKRWADIFRVPLRLIEGTLSALSTAYDLLTLSASSQIAIGTAESTSQILSVFATINGVWEAGEKLQLALDGPSYTAAIDEMLEDADATTVPPFGFDRGYYRRTILNHLWGVAGQSPLVIVGRASSLQREGLSVVSGALAVRSKIQKSIDLLVAEIEQEGISDDFPLEECVAQLEDLTSQIVLSQNRSIESIDYDAYLVVGNSHSRHQLSTTLGSIGALYAAFGRLAGILDEVLKIETTTEVVKVATAAGNAALFYSGTYSIEGLAEGIKVFTRVATPIAIVVDLHKVLEYGNPEEAYYSIPQEMMLALPVELSNLWMLANDVETSIRYLANLPLKQEVPVGESPGVVEVHPGESIQQAIDKAPEGAVICLDPGTYKENLVIEDSIILRGQGQTPNTVRIIEAGDSYGVIQIVGDQEIEVTIQNVTVSGGNNNGIIAFGKARVSLHNADILNHWAGICIVDAAQATLQDCGVSNNTVGLSAWNTAQAIITNCNLSQNSMSGLLVCDSACVSIKNSLVVGGESGLVVNNSAQITLQESTLSDNRRSGVLLSSKAVAEISKCHILCNGKYGVLAYSASCVDAMEEDSKFTGQVTGRGNAIPGPDKPDGNKQGALCPAYPGWPWPEGFLVQEFGQQPAQVEEPHPEIPPIEAIPEPVLVLDHLTRESVAEFLSQHPVGGKAWVRFEKKSGVSKDEIYAVASALKEQEYIQDYLRSPFGSRFAITWTTQKGSNYLREPDMEEISEGYQGMSRDFDGFVYEQNIMVALYEKDDIRVTGIQQDGSYARVEYTWKRGRTTPIFDILQPVISSNMVEEFSAGKRYDYEAYFSLYDDGWRVEACY